MERRITSDTNSSTREVHLICQVLILHHTLRLSQDRQRSSLGLLRLSQGRQRSSTGSLRLSQGRLRSSPGLLRLRQGRLCQAKAVYAPVMGHYG